MIAEHSDRLYSTDVLVSIKPMAGYCLSSPQPRRNGATLGIDDPFGLSDGSQVLLECVPLS